MNIKPTFTQDSQTCLLYTSMSAVNYSSFRGGMLGFRNTIEAYRWLLSLIHI